MPLNGRNSMLRQKMMLVVLIGLGATTVRGQTFVWSGNGANNNWDYNTGFPTNLYLNWNPASLPPPTADVFFGTGFGSGNPALNGSRTVNSLTIGSRLPFTMT